MIGITYDHAPRISVRRDRKPGAKAFPVGADVGKVADIASMFAKIDGRLAKLGKPGLDILVNNAGVQAYGNVLTLTEEAFDRTFNTNVKGLLFVTQQALPRLRDGGRIVHISSMVGHNAYPDILAYAATKAAVDSLTLSMAQGLAPRGITVNAVAPGATDTDFMAGAKANPEMMKQIAAMAALNRVGQPEDIAGVVTFLCTQDAGWITGERIRASGGMRL